MVTYIKRLIILTGILSLTFVAACGGGDDSQPPPAPPTLQGPSNQQALMDLMAQAQRAKQSCTQDYTPMFMAMAMSTAGAQQPGAQPGAQPGGMAAILPQLMQQNQGANCQSNLMNLMMAFTSIMVPSATPGGAATPYANDPAARQWMAMQLAGIANRIWGGVQQTLTASGIPVTAAMGAQIQSQLLQGGMALVQQRIIPGLGSFAGAAGQGFSQYAGHI